MIKEVCDSKRLRTTALDKKRSTSVQFRLDSKWYMGFIKTKQIITKCTDMFGFTLESKK